MKEILSMAIVHSITKEKKTIGSISNYGIIRYASGIFMVRVYWKGQTKKGDKRCITIELDTEPESAVMAIEIMEELMEEARKVCLKDKMKFLGFSEENEIEKKKYREQKNKDNNHKEPKKKIPSLMIPEEDIKGW